MAQRFGGKFSPDGNGTTPPAQTGGYRGARRTRAGGRVNLLFMAPLPLAVRAFTSGPVEMALNLTALGLLLLAAWLTREGILAQEAYEARKIARRPAIPRKIFASLLTGAGLGLAGFAIGGVAPIGHLAPVKVYLDEDLTRFEGIWAAAGAPNAVFATTASDLLKATGATVIRMTA